MEKPGFSQFYYRKTNECDVKCDMFLNSHFYHTSFTNAPSRSRKCNFPKKIYTYPHIIVTLYVLHFQHKNITFTWQNYDVYNIIRHLTNVLNLHIFITLTSHLFDIKSTFADKNCHIYITTIFNFILLLCEGYEKKLNLISHIYLLYMSCVLCLCPVSYALCPMSIVQCSVSCVLCTVSCV